MPTNSVQTKDLDLYTGQKLRVNSFIQKVRIHQHYTVFRVRKSTTNFVSIKVKFKEYLQQHFFLISKCFELTFPSFLHCNLTLQFLGTFCLKFDNITLQCFSIRNTRRNTEGIFLYYGKIPLSFSTVLVMGWAGQWDVLAPWGCDCGCSPRASQAPSLHQRLGR